MPPLAQMGNSWRTTKDISLDIEGTWDGVVHNLINNVNLAKYAGPGGWNDADMLLVRSPLPPPPSSFFPLRIELRPLATRFGWLLQHSGRACEVRTGYYEATFLEKGFLQEPCTLVPQGAPIPSDRPLHVA